MLLALVRAFFAAADARREQKAAIREENARLNQESQAETPAEPDAPAPAAEPSAPETPAAPEEPAAPAPETAPSEPVGLQ